MPGGQHVGNTLGELTVQDGNASVRAAKVAIALLLIAFPVYSPRIRYSIFPPCQVSYFRPSPNFHPHML